MKLPYVFVDATKISQLKERVASQEAMIEQCISFIKEMQSGNMASKLERLQDNKLSQSLISMQEHLKRIDQQEKDKKWITDGFGQFIDIIRQGNENLDQLCDNIIKFLVRYLKVNQGALFLQTEEKDETYLTLSACYAYDRKKYHEKRISIGEGLVGQCYLEKEMIYMSQVPKGYTTITSGLGEATPSAILLMPLKTDNNILGVLELASFRTFQPFHFEFLTKLSETIASHIFLSKVNARTAFLMESYRGQAEALKEQEQEMKQSMEELMATQESQARLQHELKIKLEELELAKKELEVVKQTESDRMKKQNEVQTKIMNSTIEKFKKREMELLRQLEEFETTKSKYPTLNYSN